MVLYGALNGNGSVERIVVGGKNIWDTGGVVGAYCWYAHRAG